MVKFVECANCHTTLQLPSGAQSIRCAICCATVSTDTTELRKTSRLTSYMNNYFPILHGRASPTAGQKIQPPPAFGRKRALIIGITYKNTKDELQGCINDAKCMKFLLVNRFKFPQEAVIMLTEEERDPHRIPTIRNIRKAIYWLMQGVKAGDSLVFHFSGHGLQQRNYTLDEVDGYDETLCPLDYEKKGMIVDDELNATLVRPLPRGAKLHAIIDACHSELDDMCGKTIVLDQEHGKEQVEERLYLSVVVMIIKSQQIQIVWPRSCQLVQCPSLSSKQLSADKELLMEVFLMPSDPPSAILIVIQEAKLPVLFSQC
ncbi:metacaspase-1-like isoform X2 [Solanum stenotomum]|uniref:metacaspase-1-like isoform X2 n=1 Tax=Solanum stenotomum TaxID=172797 RepID=UPI0020D1B228|nr:metacaspase-1-like isoform X2 [Solanum stenotomum]